MMTLNRWQPAGSWGLCKCDRRNAFSNFDKDKSKETNAEAPALGAYNHLNTALAKSPHLTQQDPSSGEALMTSVYKPLSS